MTAEEKAMYEAEARGREQMLAVARQLAKDYDYIAPASPKYSWMSAGIDECLKLLEEEHKVLEKAALPAQPEQEHNFCQRCGKRTNDIHNIHTCTPPTQEPMHPELKKLYEDFFDKCFKETEPAPAQEPVGWVLLRRDDDGLEPVMFYGGKQKPEGEFKDRFTLRPVCFVDATPPAAQRQHVTDGSLCWCEPETSYTDPETGASVVVHKGPQ